MKHTLYVKQSTSNIITIGECGQTPPSLDYHTNVIKYMDRVMNMNDCHIVKQVYNRLPQIARGLQRALQIARTRGYNLVK